MMLVSYAEASEHLEPFRSFSEGGLEYVNCNLCGKNDTTQLYQMGKVGIVRCNHCGLVYTNPRLSEEERLKVYNVEYFTGKKPRADLEGGSYDYLSDIAVDIPF